MLTNNYSASPPPSLFRKRPPKMTNVGFSRRATNFFPALKRSESTSVTIQSGGAEIRRHLLRLEAEEANCCIKIESNKFRSRSVLLISRGRVLECVYGKFGLSNHLTGKQAFKFISDELLDKETSLKTYYGEEQLIIAGAALIHGAQISSANKSSFAGMVDNIVSNRGAACLAALDPTTGGTICIVYLCPSGLLEISSFTADIEESNVVSLFDYLRDKPGVKMLGSFLERDKITHLMNSNYSLNGLDYNRMQGNMQKTKVVDVDEHYSAYLQDYKELASENFQRKFLRSKKESSSENSSNIFFRYDSRSQFQINPAARMS